MSTPGPVMSGLGVPSRFGPRLEKSAIRSCLSTAPTVSAVGALPGDQIVRRPSPELPAATTNRALPESRAMAASIGSTPGVSGEPRLMLTTCAPWSTAHCMPATMPEMSPKLSSPRTLPSSSFASGATPLLRPPDFAPLPAMVEATCVPCP